MDDELDWFYSVTWRRPSMPESEPPYILDFDGDDQKAESMALWAAIALAEQDACDVTLHAHTSTPDPRGIDIARQKAAFLERILARSEAPSP